MERKRLEQLITIAEFINIDKFGKLIIKDYSDDHVTYKLVHCKQDDESSVPYVTKSIGELEFLAMENAEYANYDENDSDFDIENKAHFIENYNNYFAGA